MGKVSENFTKSLFGDNMITSFTQLVASIPYPLRQGLKYAYGTIPPSICYGKLFRETYSFLQKSQWWSKERLEEWQLDQLNKLLRHAYENVPYYQWLFDERGLKPKDFQDFKDLRQLPYLTKEIIRNNMPNLVAKNFPKFKLQYGSTGGSTGIPLGFYCQRVLQDSREWAFMLTLWERVGFKVGDRCVVLRGKVVKSANKGKFWEFDPLHKSLILSSYHLTDANIPQYINEIRKFKPDFIQAYPSAITILASFMKEHNIMPLPTVKAILCGSENLYIWQRELLEKVFQCRVYSWYGHAEHAVLAGECEQSCYYHIFPEYGIAELVGKDGNFVREGNKTGEIVATGFNNFAMPFIRYCTEDLAITTNVKCECGRNYPLLKSVEGRLQELIITRTGRLISMTAINMHSDVFDNVRQFQFYQDKMGEIIFYIVKKSTYTGKDTDYIYRELRNKIGADTNLIIKFVDEIPRTERGKYRFLIQKLPIDFGD